MSSLLCGNTNELIVSHPVTKSSSTNSSCLSICHDLQSRTAGQAFKRWGSKGCNLKVFITTVQVNGLPTPLIWVSFFF